MIKQTDKLYTPVAQYLRHLPAWRYASQEQRDAFIHVMQDRAYGRVLARSAWRWFKAGWAAKHLQTLLAQESVNAELTALHEKIEALLDHCPDGECTTCARIICPHKDPLHFHHDGCPACAEGSGVEESGS
jgi:hypothetical protein